MCKLSRDNLQKFEDDINLCKESANVLVANGNGILSIGRVKYKCMLCDTPIYYDIDKCRPIDYRLINCPTCNDKTLMAAININDN